MPQDSESDKNAKDLSSLWDQPNDGTREARLVIRAIFVVIAVAAIIFGLWALLTPPLWVTFGGPCIISGILIIIACQLDAIVEKLPSKRLVPRPKEQPGPFLVRGLDANNTSKEITVTAWNRTTAEFAAREKGFVEIRSVQPLPQKPPQSPPSS